MEIKLKKSLGQNFLKDKNIIKSIVEIGNIKKNSVVLEIGPGTGNLTEFILKKNPKKIFVIEKDSNLVNILNNKFKNNSICDFQWRGMSNLKRDRTSEILLSDSVNKNSKVNVWPNPAHNPGETVLCITKDGNIKFINLKIRI